MQVDCKVKMVNHCESHVISDDTEHQIQHNENDFITIFTVFSFKIFNKL